MRSRNSAWPRLLRFGSSARAGNRAAEPARHLSMRSRLQRLSIAGILPLAIACGIAFAALVRLQRDAAEVSTLELARALGTAVRVELGGSIATLQALSASPLIDAG